MEAAKIPMPTQYDNIGKRYKGFSDLPPADIQSASILKYLGNVEGLSCLDLACGLGDWSRFLIEQGASQTTGVDVSESMIKAARESVPEDKQTKMSFFVGDCSKALRVDGGPFDLVFAAWLLNYAPDFNTMLSMWRVIHDNLKPGGRFVGVTPNTFCPMFEPFDDSYGISVVPIEQIGERGWKCRLTAHIEPEPVQFDTYHFLHDFYERAAAEAGMSDVRWHPAIPPDDERKDNGFWDKYFLRPHMSILTAKRR